MTHEQVTIVLFYFCIYFTVITTVIIVGIWKMTKYMYRIARVFEMLVRDTGLLECPLARKNRREELTDTCPIDKGGI